MSRASPSRSSDRRRRSGWRRGRSGLLALGLLAAVPTGRAAGDECEPFARAAPDGGGAECSASALAGEVLLALPKRPDGSIPTDFVLGPGARVAESFFSPVLCATVVRVVGPPDAGPAELVPGVPDGAIVVPHSRYRTAAGPTRAAAAPGSGPDPYRVHQYGLDWMRIEAARSITDGRGVRVALLDSAPDVSHRDLATVRLLPLEGGPPASRARHGTLLAGVIAAVEANGFGIAGVAPGAELVAVPVCTPAPAATSDECRLYDLLRGIDRAWESGAQLLNLSLVGPANPLLERAVSRAERIGLLLVAAAGDEGGVESRYPAAYPSVIGVGAVDRDGAPSGSRSPSAEILAPGVEIVSTLPGDGFGFEDGTSLAAAHVSGVLALLLAAGGDADAARAALFQASYAAPAASGAEPPPLPPVCSILTRLGHACPGP